MQVVMQSLLFLKTRVWLVVLGVGIELLTLFSLVRPFPLFSYYHDLTDMGIISNFSHSTFLTFILSISGLFILAGLAWWEALRWQDRGTLCLILGFGIILALTMIFVYPVTAIDVYIYLVTSLVIVQHHANPMVTAPLQFAASDPLMNLSGNFVSSPSPYGPLGLLIQAIPTSLVGRNVLAMLLLMKLLFSTCLLVAAFFVYKILRHLDPKRALAGTLALAWNPYFLFEYCANSHNDIVMLALIVLGTFALVKDHKLLALTLITASALIKFASLPLVPLFLLYGIVHQPDLKKRLMFPIWSTLSSGLLLIVSFIPFWSGPQTLSRFFNQTQDSLYSFSKFLADLSNGLLSADQTKLIGMSIFGCFFLIALWQSTCDLHRMLAGCFLVMFALLAFGVTYVQVWYIGWPAILAILVPRIRTSLCLLFVTYAAMLVELVHTYIFPWGGLGNPSSFAIINSVAYLMLFAPGMFLLVADQLNQLLTWKKRISTGTPTDVTLDKNDQVNNEDSQVNDVSRETEEQLLHSGVLFQK